MRDDLLVRKSDAVVFVQKQGGRRARVPVIAVTPEEREQHVADDAVRRTGNHFLDQDVDRLQGPSSAQIMEIRFHDQSFGHHGSEKFEQFFFFEFCGQLDQTVPALLRKRVLRDEAFAVECFLKTLISQPLDICKRFPGKPFQKRLASARGKDALDGPDHVFAESGITAGFHAGGQRLQTLYHIVFVGGVSVLTEICKRFFGVPGKLVFEEDIDAGGVFPHEECVGCVVVITESADFLELFPGCHF